MAAITFATSAANGTTLDEYNPALRTASAQATTGQTDWFWVPSWAKVVTVYFNLTAITGTSSTLDLFSAYPATLDDGDTVPIIATASTSAVTAASLHVYSFGPTLTTAGTDSTTADAFLVQNAPMPSVLGLTVTNVVGGGAFTYTLAAKCER